MTARPFRTFQSEGWYRPGYARTDHYFRLTGTGDLPLVALCDRHTIREVFRQHLAVRPGDRCKLCFAKVRAALGSTDADWFGEPAEEWEYATTFADKIEPVARGYTRESAQKIADECTEINPARPWIVMRRWPGVKSGPWELAPPTLEEEN
ncbi:hypothetical protein [Rathayibacter rathayi]|uniref:hypothetical protein n=1 Tax=Rathayibacter rathayi TaxID=33887 RepID=UPI000CE7CCB0|nr:hypothetical protein [Rathayibacter rathayi]PPG86107.1 hypothetical protein C5C47_12630 [Rathayibacter rathayi]